MDLGNIYLIASTVVIILLSFIWKKEDWLNLFIKLVLIVLGMLGVVLILINNGYMVKV